jgi:hypothetical protein
MTDKPPPQQPGSQEFPAMRMVAPPHPKLAGASGKLPAHDVRAVISVSRENYVPDHVCVRGRITPTLLSADIPYGSLEAVLDDPCVEAVQIADRLQCNCRE